MLPCSLYDPLFFRRYFYGIAQGIPDHFRLFAPDCIAYTEVRGPNDYLIVENFLPIVLLVNVTQSRDIRDRDRNTQEKPIFFLVQN